MKQSGNAYKAQAALDFMISYGVAIVIIVAALAAVYFISAPTKQAFTSQECVATSGFACGYMFLYFNGIMNISIVQATGGDITIYGIACSSTLNGSTSSPTPTYGNIYTTNTVAYYPSGSSPGTGVKIFSGASHNFLIYCYNQGGRATSAGGQTTYAGYLWINYSLPGTGTKVTQLVAALSAEYI